MDTKTRILDLAEELTQTRGFSGFSYLDLAETIGIKSPSIHYHFKSKDDLALALVKRIRTRHQEQFIAMDNSIKAPKARLKAVVEFFQSYAVESKFCLCGMLAAELQTVSTQVAHQIDQYFVDFQDWLTRQFGELGHKDSKKRALSFLSALEGSLLLARLRHDPTLIRDALKEYI